jgi:hypothetical protein
MSEVNELAEKLKAEGEKFIAIFSAFTDEQWTQEIRQGSAGAADDFSIDRYNAAMQERTKELSPVELIEQYKLVRDHSVAWVAGLKLEELEIKGRHPFLQMTTIREMIKMLYIHNMTHYRDMKKVINS